MTDKSFYTYEDLAELLGLTKETVRQYASESKPGRQYADNPFPKPDGKIGKSPIWLASRRDEIVQWAASRAGRGAGGGRRPS